MSDTCAVCQGPWGELPKWRVFWEEDGVMRFFNVCNTCEDNKVLGLSAMASS